MDQREPVSPEVAPAPSPAGPTPPMTEDQREALVDFARTMREETIPAIVETLEMRKESARTQRDGNNDAATNWSLYQAWRKRAEEAELELLQLRAALAGGPYPEPFPAPRRQDTPCGECHLQRGETCDICGAKERSGEPSPEVGALLDELVSACEPNGDAGPRYAAWKAEARAAVERHIASLEARVAEAERIRMAAQEMVDTWDAPECPAGAAVANLRAELRASE